jgi:glycosyltransferase involved in cell wall biosynthesis
MAALVTIILPTYNRLGYLKEAVQSVMLQSCADWELLIADDGSSDETLGYLGSLDNQSSIRVLHLEHSGNPPRVRNAALQEARGEFVAFIDSDDVWLPGKLTQQLQDLRSLKARWSFTDFELVDSNGLPRAGPHAWYGAPECAALLRMLLCEQVHIAQSSVVVQRKLLEAVDGYDESLPVCGDYDLWMRLSRLADPLYVDSQLVKVRRHASHYASDVESLDDLERTLLKAQASRCAPELDEVIRRRRVRIASNRARACSLEHQRVALLRSLLSSASYSWEDADWWTSGAKSLARAFTPGALWKAGQSLRATLRPSGH